MASSTLISSTSKFGIELSRNRVCGIHSCLQVRARHKSTTFSVKMAQAGSGEFSNFKLQLDVCKEKLWRVTPEPVKNFPWKKAQDVVVERLLVAGGNGLKWCLIVLYIFSLAYDVVVTLLSTQELVLPFGLFVGCLMSDFLKEVAQEMVPTSQENKSKWILVGISCFFVLVKIAAWKYLTLSKQLFLWHVSNGGLLQALWRWRNLSKQNHEADEQTLVS